jgi:hypothetical protein
MIALHESENWIDAERLKRSIARTAGDCACEAAPGLPNDRAMRNLELLYGGAPQRIAPVFALGAESPGVTGRGRHDPQLQIGWAWE